MLKRMSRVFFGFPPKSVSENTLIGSVELSFNGGPLHSYSLYYSDNKMDKLNLPMPGTIGPSAYDNKYLLFSQINPQIYGLVIGTKAEKTAWLNKSKAISGNFKMASGREWGVF